MKNKNLKKWPRTIFLQRDGYKLDDENYNHIESCWSWHEMDKDDVEYIRADISNKQLEDAIKVTADSMFEQMRYVREG